jgi:hypothetical protein
LQFIEKNSFARGKGFFKLNTSLLLDKDYVELIRKLIQKQKNIYDEQNVNPNLKWEMIKSDIRGETIKYSSKIAKINKVKTINIERELTELQNKKQASNRKERFTFCSSYMFFCFCINFLISST